MKRGAPVQRRSPGKKVRTAREVALPSCDDIALRAYEIFLSRGGEHGYDVEDWLQAERQIVARTVQGGAGRQTRIKR